MKPKLSSNFIFTLMTFVFFGLHQKGFCEVPRPRMGVQGYDQSKVMDIRIVPGLITLLQLPCVAEDFSLGNEATIEAKPSSQNARNILLKAKAISATPTNLIIQCSNRVLVFDIVPNGTVHQDYIKVPYAFGMTQVIGSKTQGTLIDSSEMRSSKSQGPKRVLIDSSDAVPVTSTQTSGSDQ